MLQIDKEAFKRHERTRSSLDKTDVGGLLSRRTIASNDTRLLPAICLTRITLQARRSVSLRQWYRVSIKSLYNIKNLSQRQIERQISGNYCKMRRIYFSFFFFLFHLIHFYMGAISCTKHIEMVLDFLHDRCFPQMFFVVLPLSNTVP